VIAYTLNSPIINSKAQKGTDLLEIWPVCIFRWGEGGEVPAQLGPLERAIFNHKETKVIRACADLDQILWMGGNKKIYNKDCGNIHEP
jgi:hypothetical protein